MAERKLIPSKPASITSAGPVTFFVPTAEPILDEEGKEVPPGFDALELQRSELEAVQQSVVGGEDVEAQEERELLQAATTKAAEEKISLREAYTALKEQKEDDAKFLEELSGVKRQKSVPVKDEAKPKVALAPVKPTAGKTQPVAKAPENQELKLQPKADK